MNSAVAFVALFVSEAVCAEKCRGWSTNDSKKWELNSFYKTISIALSEKALHNIFSRKFAKVHRDSGCWSVLNAFAEMLDNAYRRRRFPKRLKVPRVFSEA